MKYKKIIAFIIVGALAVSITACVGTNKTELKETAYPVTVSNIQIDNSPNKVASLSPTVTSMLIQLGFGDKIVGYPDDYTGENVTDGNKIGTGLALNMDKIGELAPEIIFSNVPITKAEMDKLSAVNVRVLVMPTPTTIEDVKLRYMDIIKIMRGQLDADIFGKEVIDEIDRTIAAINGKMPEKQSFLYIASLDPAIATEDTIQSAIATAVIGENVAKGYEGYSVPPEKIATLNPNIILYDDSIDPESIKKSEIFMNLGAVKDNKMYRVNGTEMSLSTNGLASVLLNLAKTISPDTDFTVAPPASSQTAE